MDSYKDDIAATKNYTIQAASFRQRLLGTKLIQFARIGGLHLLIPLQCLRPWFVLLLPLSNIKIPGLFEGPE